MQRSLPCHVTLGKAGAASARSSVLPHLDEIIALTLVHSALHLPFAVLVGERLADQFRQAAIRTGQDQDDGKNAKTQSQPPAARAAAVMGNTTSCFPENVRTSVPDMLFPLNPRTFGATLPKGFKGPDMER